MLVVEGLLHVLPQRPQQLAPRSEGVADAVRRWAEFGVEGKQGGKMALSFPGVLVP